MIICPKCGLSEIMRYKYLGMKVAQCEICGYAWDDKDELSEVP